MPIDEVFPSPTVKQVIFQIRFPSLFYIESRIGDYQVRIMERFPDARLVLQRQIVIAELGPEGKVEDLPEEARAPEFRRIWQFRSAEGVELSVQADSLTLMSTAHKTYCNPKGESRFRDTIEFTVDRFLELVAIPLMGRIGLRYVDECPVPQQDNETYARYYRTAFPLDRFPVSDASEMSFRVDTRRGEYHLRYAESLKVTEGQVKLTLDFDGYAEGVESEQYLAVTDKLHDIILKEFEGSIRQPVIDYMRSVRE